MTLWELKRGDLIATMKLVDEKDNINDVLRLVFLIGSFGKLLLYKYNCVCV